MTNTIALTQNTKPTRVCFYYYLPVGVGVVGARVVVGLRVVGLRVVGGRVVGVAVVGVTSGQLNVVRLMLDKRVLVG